MSDSTLTVSVTVLRVFGGPVQPVRSVSAIDDVLDVARAVSPEDPGNVVLFGLCSSGYQVLEAALDLLPRGVCAAESFHCVPPA